MNDDDWDFFNKSVGKLEKEVITLKKENERLKKNIHSMLFTDDVIQDRYDKAKREIIELKKLLKECKLAIFDYPPYDLASDKIRLQIKINQVLGEE